MNHKSRMQNRRLRSDGWDPIHHNQHVALMKKFKEFSKRQRQISRAFNKLSLAAQGEVAFNNLVQALRQIRSDYNNVR